MTGMFEQVFTSRKAIRQSTLQEAVDIAVGCQDYGGGYRGNPELLAAYHHGMQTVATVLRDRMQQDSYQAEVVHQIGRDERLQKAK